MPFEGKTSGAKRGKFRLTAWEVSKPVFSFLDRCAVERAHTVDSVRKEESTIWVDQPPLALNFLRAKETGRFEIRTCHPTTVLIPVLWAWIIDEFFGFLFTTALQIGH